MSYYNRPFRIWVVLLVLNCYNSYSYKKKKKKPCRLKNSSICISLYVSMDACLPTGGPVINVWAYPLIHGNAFVIIHS